MANNFSIGGIKIFSTAGTIFASLVGATTYLYDSKFKEEEYNMTKETVRRLQEINAKDKANSEIISDGK